MKVAVLLSGGVDSSVALFRLMKSGVRDITAFYIKVWLEDELSFLGECPWEEDLRYARAVCDRAGVPLKVISLQREYFQRVVSYSIAELKEGRTPSPDILCNQRIKFGLFLDRVKDGFDRIATGHYAQVAERNGVVRLKRSPDPVKDQTYFLSHLSQEQLARALFPVGHLAKSEVRRMARNLGLPNRDRKDSQGICFLGRIRFRDFVRAYLGERAGAIVDARTGRTLGEHRGYWFYTIGQRQGLGLGEGPWYVVDKDVPTNTVFVSHGEELENRARNRFAAGNLNWIAGPPERSNLEVKIRHGPQTVPCEVRWIGAKNLEVTMASRDPGVAPGQFAVFYQQDICLGGGVIEEGPSEPVASGPVPSEPDPSEPDPSP
jgi:tRNA-specific 2-thiouridylase